MNAAPSKEKIRDIDLIKTINYLPYLYWVGIIELIEFRKTCLPKKEFIKTHSGHSHKIISKKFQVPDPQYYPLTFC